MLALILSPLFRWAAVGVVVVGLALGVKYYRGQNAILKLQVAAQKDAITYYEKQGAVDEKTQEVSNEIQKAVDADDYDRVSELYRMLREHHRTR